MFERFTEKSIKLVNNAIEEARRLNHRRLHSRHILIALLESPFLGSRILSFEGIDVNELRKKIKEYATEEENREGEITFSNSLKEDLKQAWEEARKLGANYITPEHILLSILSREDKPAFMVLREFDIDVENMKSRLRKVVKAKIEKPYHPEISEKSESETCECYSFSNIKNEPLIGEILKKSSKLTKRDKLELIGTEQIFLSILEENEALRNLFENEGITLKKFEEYLRNNPSRDEERFEDRYIFTPKAFASMNIAYETAKELGETTIKPEHLILGILKEKAGKTVKFLEKMGTNTDTLYQQIIHPIEKQKPITLSIIKLAQAEAHRFGNNVVGTEMILLGILGEGSNIASKVLNDLGITIKDARLEVEKIIQPNENYHESNTIPFSPRAKKLLQISWQKAKAFSSPAIKPEHMLLAFIDIKDCLASKILENLAVDTIEIKQGILKEIRKI